MSILNRYIFLFYSKVTNKNQKLHLVIHLVIALDENRFCFDDIKTFHEMIHLMQSIYGDNLLVNRIRKSQF